MGNLPKIPKDNIEKGKNLLQRTRKIAQGIASLLAAAGIFTSSVPASAANPPQPINQRVISNDPFKAKPLIMEMKQSGVGNLHAQHDSHYSHDSHDSHSSHDSHYSHYSGGG